jgi:hypothetical protein
MDANAAIPAAATLSVLNQTAAVLVRNSVRWPHVCSASKMSNGSHQLTTTS